MTQDAKSYPLSGTKFVLGDEIYIVLQGYFVTTIALYNNYGFR